MGIVVDFFTRTLARPATADEILIADIEIARSQVRASIAQKCSSERVAFAQAKAERSVRAGLDVKRAVRRAVAWALCATDPNPPNAPAPIAA
jgi:hypothetical protein